MQSGGRTGQVRLWNRTDAAMVTCGASDPGPPRGTAPEPRPELPRDPELGEPGPELTVHGLLLEEGRHGQRPRPGGPPRPGSVRPGSGDTTGRRTDPGEGSQLTEEEEDRVSKQDLLRAWLREAPENASWVLR